jgi:hypothetical protein
MRRGRRVSRRQSKEEKLVYCEDPFGNIIEAFSHS